MPLRTYGDKPKKFQDEENGEYWYTGLEVGTYLGLNSGILYRRYPGMFRRSVTTKERKRLVKLGINPHIPAASIFLVRVSEVEDIIKGNGNKYKTTSDLLPRQKRKYQRSIPSTTTSSHLKPIPPSRQINPERLNVIKKFRSLSRCFEDRNPLANMKTAAWQEISMPLRTDEEIEARRLGDISTWNNDAKREPREDRMEEEKTEATVNSSQLEAALNQKCRLCLKTHDQFLELFGSDGVLPLKIMALASVKIERGDGLPSVICVSCRKLLDISYNFKCLVEKSDSALHESDTALRALLIYSSLFTGTKMNQNVVKESLARSVNKDFVMQYESQRPPLQNINHKISNDYNNRRDSVAREINKECMSGNNHSHKKGPKDKNRDNELDNEKQAGKDENFNECEIIARFDSSEILLIDPLGDGVSQSIQSMKSESEPIERNELLLPEVIDLSEEEGNHHQADEIILHSDVHEFRLKNNLLSGREYKAIDVSSESNKLETAKCKTSIGKITDTDNDSSLNSELSEQPYSDCIQSFPTNPELSSHNTIHENANELRYTCFWCEEQFANIAKLMNHVTNNHEFLNNENRVDIENNCGRVETIRKIDKLDTDMGGSIDKQRVEKKNFKFECKVCGRGFIYGKSFLSHIDTHPGYKEAETSDNSSERLKQMRESWKRENHLSNSKLNKSDNNNLTLKRVQCIKCGKFYSSKRNLRRHIKLHNNVRFNCSICGEEFLHPNELQDHEETKHKGRIPGTSDDEDYDTVDKKRKETECRPH